MARVRHDDGGPPEETVQLREGSQDRRDRVELRPQSFDEYVGQRELIGKLRIFVKAANLRGDPLDHVLFHGPPGLGKTTLAQIVANEMGVRLHVTSGPAVEHKGVLAGLLTGLGDRDVLFVDEIHRLSPTVEESLYPAMEDGRIDMPMGEGSRARTMSFELPPFTLVGATTRTALLSAPLRDRFQISEGLALYEERDLARIASRAAELLGMPVDDDAALLVGRRSRGTPRLAIRNTRRVRDFAQVAGLDRVDADSVTGFLDKLGVDRAGLVQEDRDLLTAMFTHFGGGPVGVDALAATLGTPRDTIEDVREPFLLQLGFLLRTPRGRVATPAAARHLGLESP